MVLDEAVIRELHRRVLWNQSPLLTPGEYRRGENRVVDGDGTLIFRTPPSGDVPELMRQFTAWLATATDRHAPPVVAALAHLEFVAVHPFNDGNGRTARAIARLILVRHGYALGALVSLDAQLDLDRPAYFAAIREAIGQDYMPGYDATPFARYFVGSITRSADYVLARLRGLGEVMIEIRRAIADGSLPPPMIDGLAFAWVNRHIRARDYIRLTGRSPQNTTRDLDAAVKGGWLRATASDAVATTCSDLRCCRRRHKGRSSPGPVSTPSMPVRTAPRHAVTTIGRPKASPRKPTASRQ